MYKLKVGEQDHDLLHLISRIDELMMPGDQTFMREMYSSGIS